MNKKRVDVPIGTILGFFIPLIIGLLVLYILLPEVSMISQLFGNGDSFSLLLWFLIIPVEVQLIVPWVAWIASGFVGGILSKKILVPFISMYISIWVLIYLIDGSSLTQQFSMLGTFGLTETIIWLLVINGFFSLLAFGFGGWIGACIGEEIGYTSVKKTTAIVVTLVVVGLVIGGLFHIGFFEDFSFGTGKTVLGNIGTDSALDTKVTGCTNKIEIINHNITKTRGVGNIECYIVDATVKNIAGYTLDIITVYTIFYDSDNNELHTVQESFCSLPNSYTEEISMKVYDDWTCEYFDYIDHISFRVSDTYAYWDY